MKHATEKALEEINDLLAAARSHAELKEKKRGIFYYKSSAFLHFHEDAAGLFADLRMGDDFQRFAVNSPAERKKLLAALKTSLQRRHSK
jgi:hypothetical protein